jgi:hypothetical protein
MGMLGFGGYKYGQCTFCGHIHCECLEKEKEESMASAKRAGSKDDFVGMEAMYAKVLEENAKLKKELQDISVKFPSENLISIFKEQTKIIEEEVGAYKHGKDQTPYNKSTPRQMEASVNMVKAAVVIAKTVCGIK